MRSGRVRGFRPAPEAVDLGGPCWTGCFVSYKIRQASASCGAKCLISVWRSGWRCLEHRRRPGSYRWAAMGSRKVTVDVDEADDSRISSYYVRTDSLETGRGLPTPYSMQARLGTGSEDGRRVETTADNDEVGPEVRLGKLEKWVR